MIAASKFSVLFVLTLLLDLAAAEQCNADVATQQSTYIGTFTWQDRTMTVGPVSSSRAISSNFQATATNSASDGSSEVANSWIQIGQDAVNSVGFRKVKRADTDLTLECQDSQICMNNEGGVPFCLDERTGGWYSASGYEGNSVSGNYTAPDGAKGNVYRGPCPGSFYEETSQGYCAIVPAEQRGEEATASANGSATVTGDGEAVATESTSIGSMILSSEGLLYPILVLVGWSAL